MKKFPIELDQLSIHPIQFALLGELEYAYIEKGEGEPVFLLHGFPDLANTWDDTITFLSQQGYRVIAPFLRGYYPTATVNNGDYSVKSINEDIQKLADHLGIDKFTVVGHDWGASIGYALANFVPERIQKLVTLAVPHPRLIKPSLKLLIKARHFVLFRFKKLSVWYTRRKNFKYIDKIYAWWSPNWNTPQEILDRVKSTFELPGRLEAAIGYYWSLFATVDDTTILATRTKRTGVPTLCFAGGADGTIDISQFEGMDKAFLNYFQMEIFPKAGHFPHQEAPERFHEELLAFLQKSDL